MDNLEDDMFMRVYEIFSDRLWQRLGYTLIGVVPNVARLKGIEVNWC